MWESHEEFSTWITDTWQEEGKARTVQELQRKIAIVTSKMEGWGRTTFGNVRLEIQHLKEEPEKLQADPTRTGPSYIECKITDRLVELYHREEIMWQQRSRITWLAAGDKNTHFFHLRACQRRKKNRITRLKRPDGHLTEDVQEMGSLASSFYLDLYKSEGIENMEAVLNTVPVKVTAEMNDNLLAPFSEQEVKAALFQMFPTKAPGPDGLPAHFFQRNWSICGEEVTEIVLRILKGDDDPSSVNDTLIVLIPKVASPEDLAQFHPISLCNVIYKITSKVAANRLKLVLPQIISEEQSAFVPDRLITDNVITVYECLHFMKKKRK
jgi:hypothetical protein